jgi:hypothetical protein
MNQILIGLVQKNENKRGGGDGGAVIVNLPGVDAVIPRNERIPGETFHAGDRVK